MDANARVYLVGGGIGALAAAAFMIRDAGIAGESISILESAPVLGGSLDGAGDPQRGYSMRGGRMLTTDNYECTWDLFRSITSLRYAGSSVYDETVDFNSRYKANSMARLVDGRRARIPVRSMGFSMRDRMELLELAEAKEALLAGSCITDWLSPRFFETNFWYMWATTFAFQPWHSAIEFRRYLHRFMLEFSRIETLGGVKRTIYNQYDSLVLPLQRWLAARGVRWQLECTVTDVDIDTVNGAVQITGLHCRRAATSERIALGDRDVVFLQNGSMTDASSVGSMSRPPPRLVKATGSSWTLWEKLAAGRPQFGNPTAFNSCIAQSWWESFTVTLKDSLFFDQMTRFSGNEPGTGGLVTFRDSNWLMSIVLAHQPHFAAQPESVKVFWGYALSPDRIGDYVPKAMADSSGTEILEELRGHLRFDERVFATANCIPCRLPYITSMFMPRVAADRPPPVPAGTRNLAFVSQFVEIPDDVVFTVEYSVRAAQMAVYQLFGVARKIPPVTPHDQASATRLAALVKAFR